MTRFGGYSSQVVVDRWQVWRKPAATSFEQAAAMPAVYMTAWPARERPVIRAAPAGGGRTRA